MFQPSSTAKYPPFRCQRCTFRILRNDITQSVLQKIIGGNLSSLLSIFSSLYKYSLFRREDVFFKEESFSRKKILESSKRSRSPEEISRFFLCCLLDSIDTYHFAFCRDVFFKEESSSKKFSNLQNDRDHRRRNLSIFPFLFMILQTLIISRCIFQRRIFFEKILESSKYFDPTRITRRNFCESILLGIPRNCIVECRKNDNS